MALFFSTKSVATTSNIDFEITTLIINGNKYDLQHVQKSFGIMSTHHTHLYYMPLEFLPFTKIKKIILKNEWNHVEVTCEHPNVEPLTEIGIHFSKQKNNTDDIQFTNPYEKIKLNDDDDDGFYDVDDVRDDDNDDVFYDVIDGDDVLDDEDDHHLQ